MDEEFNITSYTYELVNLSDNILGSSVEPLQTSIIIVNKTTDWQTKVFEWRFLLPFYTLILILSVSGNCLVIATLAQNRRMRTVTNVYLLNLAVSDLLLGVFCLPFTLVGQVLRQFIFGAGMCKLIPYLQAVTVSVDVWTLVAISLERYFAICRPLESRRWQTRCHAYKMIVLVWVVSFAVAAPILHSSNLQTMRQTNTFKCREIWQSEEMEKAFNLGLDVALLLVPLIIMTAAYSLIVGKLWRGMRHEIRHSCNWPKQLEKSMSCKPLRAKASLQTSPPSEGNYINSYWITKPTLQEKAVVVTCGGCPYCRLEPQRHIVRSNYTDRSIEAKRKVIRMLFVVILEFFVCWAPIHVVNTIYLFYPDALYEYLGRTGVAIVQLLAYCSSCCNPITYCFMNRKFRQAFVALFKPCCGVTYISSNNQDLPARTPTASAHEQNDLTVCQVRVHNRAELDPQTGEECV